MNISGIDIRHLRYFLAVAQELSFSRAARKLNMSQPPLSAQIKNLEEQIGVVLFERTKRSVRLTDAGRQFVFEAQNLLEGLGNAVARTKAINDGQSGTLSIGANFTSLFHPAFSDMVERFRARYPDIRLVFKDMGYGETIEALQQGRIDIGFAWPETKYQPPDITFQIIERVPIKLCIAASHKLARKKAVSLDDLKKERLLLSARQQQGRLYAMLVNHAEKKGYNLDIYPDPIDFEMIMQLTGIGFGVTFTPEFLGKFASRPVKFLEVSEFTAQKYDIPVSLIYNKAQLTPIAKNFLT